MPAHKSKPSKVKATDPWTALDALFAKEAEPMGPEWFTTAQFAERYKKAQNTVTVILNDMVKDGTLVKWSGVSNNTRRTINKYRLA